MTADYGNTVIDMPDKYDNPLCWLYPEKDCHYFYADIYDMVGLVHKNCQCN